MTDIIPTPSASSGIPLLTSVPIAQFDQGEMTITLLSKRVQKIIDLLAPKDTTTPQSPDAGARAVQLLSALGDWALEGVARIEHSGIRVSSALLNAIFESDTAENDTPLQGLSIYNVTKDTVTGPVLGMILRNALLRYYSFIDMTTWVRQMLDLVEQKARGDDKHAGYSSWSAYVNATQPCGMARPQVSNLIGYWERVAPVLVAINVDPLTVFAGVPRTTVEELVSLYSDDAIDADGAKLLTSWVSNGTVMRRGDVLDLKGNYGIRHWAQLATLLRTAKLDPVAVGEDLGPEKLHYVAQFLLSGQLSVDEVAARVAQANDADVEAVSRMMGTPHGRATDFTQVGDDADPFADDDELPLDDDTAVVPASQGRMAQSVSGKDTTVSSPASNTIVLTDADMHTFILDVEQRADGMLTILGGSITPSLAARLQRMSGAIIRNEKKIPVRFTADNQLEVAEKPRKTKKA